LTHSPVAVRVPAELLAASGGPGGAVGSPTAHRIASLAATGAKPSVPRASVAALARAPSRWRLEYAKAWVNGLRVVTSAAPGAAPVALPLLPAFAPPGTAAAGAGAGLDATLARSGLGLGGGAPGGVASLAGGERGLAAEFANGLLLCGLLERAASTRLGASTGAPPRLEGVSLRPRTRAVCIANLERALQVIWRAGVRSSRVPSAEELADGLHDERAVALLPELLEALALRPARSPTHAVPALRWLAAVLRA
jgi:hypothetical protein